MQAPEILPLTENWTVAAAPAGLILRPEGARDLPFAPVRVPGTVAAAVPVTNGRRYDHDDWWFRCAFPAEAVRNGEAVALRFGGIATLAEVWLNGERILESSSMFARHEVDVTALLREQNELVMVCRSLQAALRVRRARPRWRTKVVAEQQLRWFRTTLLGRAPGFAPENEPVGPWRPVELVRSRRVAICRWTRRVSGEEVSLGFHFRPLDEHARVSRGRLVLAGATGTHLAPLEFDPDGNGLYARATLTVPNAARWWPHTHGTPHLYQSRVELMLADGTVLDVADQPVGFRTIESSLLPAGDAGLALRVNSVPVFCRGAIWTPPDAIGLNADPAARLRLLRDGGWNMLRLAGTLVYEDERFHTACDELGLLVWQDLMFANMDYPFDDAAFYRGVTTEARTELSRLAQHASTAVVCGNSEIEQQVGMLGLEPALGRGRFFGEQLPALVRECGLGVPYIPSAPCGGDLAFRTSRGVANYFGVGAYQRPLDDARRAQVRFASECLAFSHVPEPERVEEMAARTPGGISPIHPEWKRGVPRDAGAGWDFEDVRDHYLRLLYGVDPVELRYADAERYFELSRLVTGDVMAEVFGEWRRANSTCRGGIILWASDLAPGAGWGIIDSGGTPKAPYWFLKRALQPVSVWTTDEGLDGIDLHVSNDGPAPLDARLRVALYRDGERRVGESSIHLALPAHGTGCYGAEYILGRFADAAYAYRFGPPGHDLVVASLYTSDYTMPVAQAFRFPVGRPLGRASIVGLGLRAQAAPRGDGVIEVDLRSRALAWGVRVTATGFTADDMYFHLEPGVARRVAFTPAYAGAIFSGAILTAANADGRLPIPLSATAEVAA